MALVLSVAATKKRGPSASDLQSTPLSLFNRLDEEFGFTLDVAAEDAAELHRCAAYFTPRDDGLAQSWKTDGAVWCNPPYSDVQPWVRKAHEESGQHGVTVVLLVMASTGMKWFKYAIKHAAEVRLIVGNLTFGPNTHRAPFGSALIIFRAQATPGHAFVTYMNRDAKTHVCEQPGCDAKFARERQLSGHMRSAHKIRKRKQGLICGTCTNTFHAGYVCGECPDFALCKECAKTGDNHHVHPIRKY